MQQLTPHKTEGARIAPIQLLDTDEAAAAVKLGRRTFQEKVAAREIGHVKIGRCVRFHPDDLRDFIEKNRVRARGWKGGQQ